jgi:hypothetical protein
MLGLGVKRAIERDDVASGEHLLVGIAATAVVGEVEFLFDGGGETVPGGKWS